MDVLMSGAIPDTQEDALQLVDGITLDATVHVAPFAHLFGALDVVVGNIHAAGIAYLAVDDHYLAMVAAIDVVDPRKADGRILHDIDAVGAQSLEVMLLQRLVVGVVAEAVEHGTNLDTLAALLAQDVEEQRGDRVVAEVEIFEMDAALGLADSMEHVIELLLSGHQ